MHPRSTLSLVALVAFACTGSDNPRNASPPAAPPPAAPAATPSTGTAMTNPDDIAHATFIPALGIDLASMTRLLNGVYTRDLKVGTGPAAQTGSTVAIHYVGKLPDGTQFDANQGSAPPLTFVIEGGRVIPGFDWAVKGMKAGGERVAIIPPSLGYGSQAYGPLPANAILVFTLQLVSTR